MEFDMSKQAKDDGLTVWAAVSPSGEIVKSSVGSFRSIAQRYAKQRRNYVVVKIAKISPNITKPLEISPEEKAIMEHKPVTIDPKTLLEQLRPQTKRPRGRPRKAA